MRLLLKPFLEQSWPRQRAGCQLFVYETSGIALPRHSTVRVLAPHSHSKMPSHILTVSFLPAFISSLFLSWILVSLCRSFAPNLIHIRAGLYYPAGRLFHSHLYLSLDPGLAKTRSIPPDQSALLRYPSCASFVSPQEILDQHPSG
jgi:hypothetical protein